MLSRMIPGLYHKTANGCILKSLSVSQWFCLLGRPELYCPPKLKIFDQPQQIPMLSAKKITKNFFRKKILIFNAALLHLKFYYICIVVNSIVDSGQLILEANAPTSSWNFLMI